MCKLTITAGLCLIFTSLVSATSHSSKLVCYHDSAAEDRAGKGKFTVSDINPNLCTHLIYAFADINYRHRLVPRCTTDIKRYQAFNGLKIRNPLLKTLLAVGGLNYNTQKFSKMVSTQQRRAKFIRSAIKLLRRTGFDGLNLDWRYPGGAESSPQDKRRFTLLCKELKEAFVAEARRTGRYRLTVTASVSAVREIIDASYEVAKIAMYLDFINVLTFDFHGPSEDVTGHHSPLLRGSKDSGEDVYLNTNYAMRYWHYRGAPTNKLILGLAAYGRSFRLSSPSNGVGAPANGPGAAGRFTDEEGFLSYYETCLYLKRVRIQFIHDQKVPYATKGNLWVGFENAYSLGIKVRYLKANRFGGAFVWSLDLDDFRGHFCKQGNYPFISRLHRLLIPGYPGRTNPTVTSPATTPTLAGNFCKEREDGLYPRPGYPNSFYHCANGITFLKHCQSGLVFDQNCKCCNYPTTSPTTTASHSTTTGSPITTTSPHSTTTTTNTENPCEGQDDGLYPRPGYPNSFYHCANGIAFLKHCQSGLVFDQDCKCCNYPTTSTTTTTSHYTTTTSPTTTTTPHSKTTTTNTGNPCEGREDGLYPKPGYPNSFYHCANGIAFLKHCQSGLVYDQNCKCCNYPTTSTTTATHSTTTGSPITTTTPHSTTTTTNTENPCEGQDDGLYPKPGYPNSFYHCANGIAFLKHCQSGLVYDQNCKCCNYPTTSTTTTTSHYTTTGSTATTTTPHSTTTTTNTGNPCEGREDGLYPKPGYPNSYYHCANGITFLKHCQSGLVYDHNCKCCNYPTTSTTTPTTHSPTTSTTTTTQSTTTGSPTTTTTPLTTTTTTNTENPCEGQDDGLYPRPGYPNSFYHCANGIAFLKHCQSGLVFDQDCKCCNYPTTSTTTTTSHYTTTTSPTTTTTPHSTTTTTNTGNPCEGREDGLYPKPGYPNSFYHCANGIAFLKHCQSGLVFDQNCKCCNYPTTSTTTPTTHSPTTSTTTTTHSTTTGSTATTTTPHSTTTTTNTGNPCEGREDGLYPKPGYPNSYYHCANGIAFLKHCQSGLVYDHNCKCCNYPTTSTTTTTHSTTTGSSTAKTPHSTTMTTNTGNPCEGREDGLYPKPGFPNSYYHCANGIAFLKHCQSGLVFDQNCKCCNYPTTSTTTTATHSTTTGSTATTTTPLTTTTTTNTGNPCEGQNDGLYPKPGYPNSYYHCANGIAFLKHCQSGLVFDQNCKCCNYPSTSTTTTATHSTTTGSPTTTTTPHSTTTTTNTGNPCEGRDDGLYPKPGYPNSFYHCANGIAFLKHCQSGLVYDHNCKCCNYPTTSTTTTTTQSTTTGSPTTTTTPLTTTTTTNTENPCEGQDDGLYPRPGYPNSFYHCANGIAFLKHCQSGLVFDQDCKCCNYPTTSTTTTTSHYTTTTSPTTTTTTHSTTTTTNTGNPCEGREDGLYPKPGYPNSYYHCANGIAFLKHCQSGLVYDHNCKCCNYPTTSTTTPTTHSPTTSTTTTTQSTTTGSTATTTTPLTTTTTTNTGNPCEGQNDGLYPKPGYPNSYYHCANGIAFLKHCQSGLVYDHNCKCCNYPTTSTTTTTHSTTTGSSTAKTPHSTTMTTNTGNPCEGREDGLYPKPGYPNSYYHCANGIAFLKHCQSGLVFDQNCKCCNYPTTSTTTTATHSTTTGSTATTTTPLTTTTTTNTGNPCEGQNDGLYPKPGYPNSYYHCANGIAFLKHCQSGLVYDHNCKCCNYPTTSTTTTTHSTTTGSTATTTTPHSTTTTTNTGNPCEGREDGLYPKPGYPNSYYHCANGIAFLKHCQSGLVFDQNCKCCNYPTTSTTTTATHSTTTGSTATTTTPLTTTTTTNTGNPCEGQNDGLYPKPGYPNSYYHCANGIAFLKHCQSGLVYDHNCKCCNYPTTSTTTPTTHSPTSSTTTTTHSTTTGSTATTTTPHSTTTTTQTGNPCEGREDGLYPKPGYPNSYYHCANGIAFLKHCQSGLVYDHNCKCCNYPTTSTTTPTTHSTTTGSTATTTTPHSTTTTTNTGNPCEGREDGLYPKPGYPNSYYHCANGIAFLKHCQSGLVYDHNCKCCNYPTTSTTTPTTHSPTTSTTTTTHSTTTGSTATTTTPLTTTTTTNTGNPCEGQNDGLYPKPGYPNSYYHCANGIAFLKHCQSGLVYDHNCKCCNYPTTSTTTPTTHSTTTGSTATTTTPHSTTTTTNTGNPCEGREDGLYPKPGYPNSYYHCANGIAFLKHCQSGLVYDHNCKCCNYPTTSTTTPTTHSPTTSTTTTTHSTTTGSPTTTTTPHSTTTTTQTGNPCEGREDGLYPKPGYPNSYYHCANGIAFLKHCQSGLVFDQNCKCCNYPTTSTTTTATHSTTTGSTATTTTPLTTTTQTFTTRTSSTTTSPTTTTTHSTTTGSPTTTTTPHSTTTTTNTGNPCEGREDGLYPKPGYPNSYYHCANGIAFLKHCQSGLVYDHNCKCCNYPTTSTTTPTTHSPTTSTTTTTHSTTTGSTATTTTPLTTTTTTNTENPCEGQNDGLYPRPGYPNSYYHCANGIAFLKHCQSGLVYDHNCKCCNYPTTSTTTTASHSTTTGSPTTTTTPHSTTTTTQTGNPCEGQEDGLHPNPENLNSFYFCANEIPYIQNCQPGLVYRQTCKCCTYPTTSTTRRSPTTTSTKTTTPSITTGSTTMTRTPLTTTTSTHTGNFCKGKTNGIYPNPGNLNSFFFCGSEIPYIQYCQRGLLFDQIHRCCIYPTTTSPTRTSPTTTPPTTTTTY